MVNKLEKKVRKFAMGAGLIGSLIFPAGCETNPQTQALFQGMGAQLTFSVVDEAVRQGMNPQVRDNQRRLPPPNVVMNSNGDYNPSPGYKWVDPNNPKDLRVQRIQNQNRENIFGHSVDFITYNYDQDFNGNGEVDYPEECVGKKNNFRRQEVVKIAAIFKGRLSGINKVRLEVYSPNREKTYDSEEEIFHGKNSINISMISNNPGTYKCVLYLNNQVIKMHEFEIRE